LEGIPIEGTPPHLIYEYLHGYFTNDRSLVYKEIIFNLKDWKHQEMHWDKMEALAVELKG
jgi:hypothetical protein